MRLETFALERFQSVWENRVAWNLSESGVHPLRVRELLDTPELHDAVLEQSLGYPQTNGTIELRERVAAMYRGATPAHVQITNGSSEAMCLLLMRLIEPGDELVFMMPNYMQAAGLARALGATVKPWRLHESGTGELARWMVDPNELNRLVTPRTRAILICNPNNPTGARLDPVFLDITCRAAAHVGAWVVGDEVYRGAERIGAETWSVWDRGYERAIVTSGLSKAYGLPGLRIGWIVAPPDLINDLWAVHDYTTIAPGAINDRLATIALEPGRRATLLARTKSIIRTNYAIVKEWIGRQEGWTWTPPTAGAILFARYNQPIGSSELASRLRDECGVLVVPGDHFEMDGYVRIGFGSEPEYLRSALTRFGEFLATIRVHAR
jgi:aspartate/methionine/tyrosine aminotransferase